jgi:hypothetical protein
MKLKAIAAGAMALAGAAWVAAPGVGSASNTDSAIPHYQHIVEIMMENTSYAAPAGHSLDSH